MANTKQIAAKAALEFYADIGVDTAVGEEPVNRTKEISNIEVLKDVQKPPETVQQPAIPLGKNDARIEAAKLAQNANTLDELRDAIANFDGIAIKKTATNLVFSDGNPKAKIMLIGEAPGADEDRQGKPFVGVSGQLLDKILACIDIDRTAEEPEKSIYISNILNWRPPGNRTPNPAEIEVSLPFIERHIQIVKPELLIFCGGVSAKALLSSSDSISRLRKVWHDYVPKTPELKADPISAIATYHPAYLLRTPVQKRAVWADMLMLQSKMKALNFTE